MAKETFLLFTDKKKDAIIKMLRRDETIPMKANSVDELLRQLKYALITDLIAIDHLRSVEQPESIEIALKYATNNAKLLASKVKVLIEEIPQTYPVENTIIDKLILSQYYSICFVVEVLEGLFTAPKSSLIGFAKSYSCLDALLNLIFNEYANYLYFNKDVVYSSISTSLRSYASMIYGKLDKRKASTKLVAKAIELYNLKE